VISAHNLIVPEELQTDIRYAACRKSRRPRWRVGYTLLGAVIPSANPANLAERLHVARLSTIEFWPATGFIDQPWVDHPGEDAFVKTATRVCERFSEALRDAPPEAQITNRVSSIRLFTGRHGASNQRQPDPQADADGVLVEAILDPPSGFEMVRVTLPSGIENLTAHQRARLVLDVITAAAGRLAEARGWHRAPLDAARQHVIDHGYGYTAVSPWKTSRSRRHRARCAFAMADDGFGRLTLQVAEAGNDALLANAGPYLAYSTREGFTRSVRTLRWTSATSVEVVPFIDLLGRATSRVTLDLAGKQTTAPDAAAVTEPQETSQGDTTAAALPAVVVRGVGASAPEQRHEMRVCGGGPTNNTSRVYTRTLDLMLDQLETEPWRLWWGHSPVAVLDIYYWFDGARPGTRVQRRAQAGTASITRPARVQGQGADGVQQAHADVTALVDRIRARFELPEPPELRYVDPTPKATRPRNNRS
jgi:hypothetical protein